MYEQYAAAVEKNPKDFDSWVQLLAIVYDEVTLDVQNVRNTFNRFLEEFPLCFGYWNKVRGCPSVHHRCHLYKRIYCSLHNLK